MAMTAVFSLVFAKYNFASRVCEVQLCLCLNISWQKILQTSEPPPNDNQKIIMKNTKNQ